MRTEVEDQQYSILLQGPWKQLQAQGYRPWHIGDFIKDGGRGAVRCEACGETYNLSPSQPFCPICERDWLRAHISMRIHNESKAATQKFQGEQDAFNRQSNIIGWTICAGVFVLTVACIVLMSIR